MQFVLLFSLYPALLGFRCLLVTRQARKRSRLLIHFCDGAFLSGLDSLALKGDVLTKSHVFYLRVLIAPQRMGEINLLSSL